MTVDEYLKTTVAALEQAGVESARLDALILLEDALREDRALILAHPERDIPAPLAAELYKKRTQREQQLPLAYIRGKAPFFGRTFAVNTHVLVPRPESEALIELLKNEIAQLELAETLHIADIGTGSGCLGITAALELPNAHAYLYDIDHDALAVAKHNAQHFRLEATCERHDLLKGVQRGHHIILANLPYVPESMAINQAAAHEPTRAIFSGPDGLDHYKRLWAQLNTDKRPRLVLTEALPAQHHTNAALARAAGYYQSSRQGFAQAFRPLD